MYEPNINKTSDTPFSEDERKNFEQSLIHKKQTNSKKIVFVNLNSKYRVHLSGKNKSSSKPLSLKMQKKILESMDIKKESKINEKSLSNNFSKIAQSL
jgi:predicted membrane-bound spermidine synthase